MHWPIPEIPEFFHDQPRIRYRHIWMCAAVWVVLLVVVGTVVFLLGLSFLYLLIPFTLGLVAALGVFIVAFNRQAARDAWEKEKANIHQQWGAWANKRIALIDSSVVLPDELSVEGIISQTGTRYKGNCFVFQRCYDLQNGGDRLDYVIEEKILQKVSELFSLAYPITIYLVTDQVDIYEQWENRLTETAHQLGFSKLEIKNLETQQNLLDGWFEQEPEGIHVVLSLILNEDYTFPRFTENLTWLVFSSISLAEKLGWPIKQYLHRPIDVTTHLGNQRNIELKHFRQYGLGACALNAMWLPGQSDTESFTFMRELQNYDIEWEPDEFKSILCQSGAYIGNVHANDYWSELGFAAENTATIQLFGWQAEEVFRLAIMKQPQKAKAA